MGGAGRDGVTAAGLGRGLKQQMKQRVRDIALYPLFQQTEMVTQILIMLSRIKNRKCRKEGVTLSFIDSKF